MLFEPLNSSHLDQSDDLSRLPDVAEVLEGDEDEGDVEGEQGEEVDQVHRRHEELGLDRAAEQPEGQHHRPPAWQEDHLSPYSIEKITTVVLSMMSMIQRISSS